MKKWKVKILITEEVEIEVEEQSKSVIRAKLELGEYDLDMCCGGMDRRVLGIEEVK